MGRGSGTFERLLDKATSQLLLETDWESILQICDLIRQGDTQAKYAVNSIKKKVNDKNPHVALYALEVMESVVKNCGQTVHDEVANKQTMEELKELLKRQVEVNVRNKILYLIQAWAHAFRNEPKYKVVQDTYQIMKVEGHVFPEFKESDAMFAAERAPDWVDAEECHRCRVQFGVVTRKHHCRACGQIFCGKCSSKYSTIPKFGIEKEVRVCEPCYEQLNKKAEGKAASTTELPPEYLTSPLSQQSQLPPKRDETCAAGRGGATAGSGHSQSEAEEKERMRQKSTYTAHPKSEPAPLASSAPPAGSLYSSPVNSSAPLAEDIDPELARYLNRNYWEKKQEEARKSPTPSAPVPLTEPAAQPGEGHTAPNSMVEAPLPETDSQPITSCSGPFSEYQNGESEESHEQFLKALQNAVSTFVNRMKSNHMRGRSITNDSAVLSLFQSINSTHPQLLELLNRLDERRLYYEGLQDKLAQIRDAEGPECPAVKSTGRSCAGQLRRRSGQRQIQLAQKLEIMRQKKQEYLEVQRQLAIQRLQEQEKERQMRLEQQKQTVQMRAQMPAFPLPYAQLQAMPQLGVYSTSPQAQPAFLAPLAQQVVRGLSDAWCVYEPASPALAPTPACLAPQQIPAWSATTCTQQVPWGTGSPQARPGHHQPCYSSYQPTPTPGYQNVASQAPQSLPAISQPPQTSNIGYMGSQPMSMGYQPYNMQNLMTTLPGQDASLPAQHPYIAGSSPCTSRWHPALALPQQQPPWPNRHLHRDRQHRAMRPSSSPSTDLESGAHHPEYTTVLQKPLICLTSHFLPLLPCSVPSVSKGWAFTLGPPPCPQWSGSCHWFPALVLMQSDLPGTGLCMTSRPFLENAQLCRGHARGDCMWGWLAWPRVRCELCGVQHGPGTQKNDVTHAQQGWKFQASLSPLLLGCHLSSAEQ
nr:SNAP-25 interacting protein hrs-2 [Rattus norvegicus]